MHGELTNTIILLQGQYPYPITEWLINYGSGFVRRGLFGSLFLNLTPDQPWIIWLLFAFQFFVYATIFIYFALQLKKRKPNWFLTLLICSPAAICFSGWDSGAFGRKESIGYLVLIALSQSIQKFQARRAEIIWLLTAVTIFIFGVLTWEPIALLLPSIIYLLIKAPHSSVSHRYQRQLILAFSLISFVGFFVSSIFHGSQSEASSMCNNLISNGLSDPKLCGGGLYWIGVSLSSGVTELVASYPSYFIYLPFALLSLAPYFFTQWFSRHKMYLICTFIFILPLFVIALDYGRWISIFFVSTLIVLLAIDETPIIQSKHLKYVAIAFVSFWGIPHSFPNGGDMPIVSLIVTVLKPFANLLA